MRRLAIILGLASAILLAAVLALPWWLGLAVAWTGPAFGLQVGSYESIGYTRFRVSDVDYQRGPVRVHMEQAEVDTPLVWAWRYLSDGPRVVRVGAWTVDVKPPTGRAAPTKPRGWVPLRERLGLVADRLEKLLPEASAGEGVVTWPQGRLTIAGATWRQRRMTSPKVGYGRIEAAVEIDAPASGAWRAAVRAPASDASAALESVGAEISGVITWLGQRARLNAVFEGAGWLPQRASVEADGWTVPAAQVRLGANYASVRGDAKVEWQQGRWDATISAAGEPKPDSPAPPLHVKVNGQGDTNVFVVDSLDVALPGLLARLTEPVSIDRAGRLLSRASRVEFAASLAELPWLEAEGQVAGNGTVAADQSGLAVLTFDWRGEAVEMQGVRLRETSGSGELVWPRLEVRNARFVSAQGDELRWAGGWNFRTREVFGASVEGRLSHASVARWLPEQAVFDTITVEARAEGPLKALVHRGTARIENARPPHVRPLAAVVRWHGRHAAIEDFSAEVTAGESTMALTGSADREGVRLVTGSFRQGAEPRLELQQPVTARWSGTGVQLQPLRLVGPEAEVAVEGEWASTGRARASVRGVRAAWLQDLVVLPPLRGRLDSLVLNAHWNDGPVEFALDGTASVDLGEDGGAQFSLSAKGTQDGVVIDSARLAANNQDILRLSGRLPVVVRAFGQPRVAVDKQAAFAIDAATLPNPEFWARLSRAGGVEIVAPEAQTRLHGTLAQPRGEAVFRAQRIMPIKGGRDNWPRIEGLDLRLVGAQDGVTLQQFSVSVDGQLVRASGTLPITGDAWREIIRNPRLIAHRGALHVEVPNADLSVIAQRVPAYLAPKGRLQLDLTLGGDELLRGELRVQDATLRPVGALGVVQEINAEVRFVGRTATIESVTGRVGGQLVTLQGRAELPPSGAPQMDLTLRGENLPFVRRAGLLVRGDLNLRLTTPGEGTPKIGGVVRLRDSLFLTDVRALIPSGTRGGPAARPPYFSVPTPPLNRWGLDLAIEGERFLRLRTPVFAGVASARLRLGGTLGNPNASGEAIINEGSVRLPFASFGVQQGQVRLTAEQPQPQIWLTATTRRYGYDLRMELTGAVTSPNLTFSSSPPLDSEQVLLLVMTGQPPKDEIATTESQRMARVGAFFGQSLLGSFSGDAAGADRLSITSGENVSEQGRETYNIEYRLNDRWAVTGEYDEFDDYYAGLKWRFFEKGGEPEHVAE